MKYAIFLTLLFPVAAYCQEITLNKTDGFTNERIIETSIVTLKQGVSTGLGASYTEAHKNYYFNIIGYGKAGTVVNDQDQVWLVLEDGSIVKLEYRAQLPSNESEYQNVYYHHFIVKLRDVEILKDRKVLTIKIVNPEGSTDVPLKKNSGTKLQKLSDLFLREVSK